MQVKDIFPLFLRGFKKKKKKACDRMQPQVSQALDSYVDKKQRTTINNLFLFISFKTVLLI